MAQFSSGFYSPESVDSLTLKQLAQECGNADHVLVVAVKDGRAVFCALQRLTGDGKELFVEVRGGGLDVRMRAKEQA